MDQGVAPVQWLPVAFPGLSKAAPLISATARAFPSRPEASVSHQQAEYMNATIPKASEATFLLQRWGGPYKKRDAPIFPYLPATGIQQSTFQLEDAPA